MDVTDADAEWALDLVEDIEIPGWLFLPEGLTPEERTQWVGRAMEEIARVSDGTLGDGQDATAAEVRDVLEWGLEERLNSPSLAVLQVWPMRHPTAAMCHINVLPSAELPVWSETEARVHPIEAPHIGPGLQCSVPSVVWEDGQRFDLLSQHLIFDNGDVTLMLSLDEAPAPLITFALPGLFMLMDNLRMVGRDGVRFTSIPVAGMVEEAPWKVEETP